MSERAKLEEAISVLRARVVMQGEAVWGDRFLCVLAAAESYLATLPATRTEKYYELEGYRGTVAGWQSGRSLHADNNDELSIALATLHRDGFTKIIVTTKTREVPA